MNSLKFLIFLSLVWLFVGCKTKTVVNTKGEEVVMSKKAIKLKNKWVLELLKEKPLNPTIYKQDLPYITLYPSDKRMEGFTGCNRMHSNTIKLNDKSISFGDIRMTKKYCGKDINEQTLINALKASSSYEIKKGKLYLYNNKRALLVFKQGN